MLGLKYFNPQNIKGNRETIKSYLEEEGASPVIKSGRAKDIILKHIVDHEAKILDAAPGTGSLLESLFEAGFENLYGADIDNYLKFTKLKEFQQTDFCFEKLPWPDKYFDAITSFETIEHLENPHNFIREIRRVLKDDGVFILSMPNVQHIFNKIFFLRKGDMPRWRKNNNHISLFPLGVFQKSFLPYFEIKERGFFMGFFPYRFLSKLNIFPETELFAHTVYYIFKPKTVAQ